MVESGTNDRDRELSNSMSIKDARTTLPDLFAEAQNAKTSSAGSAIKLFEQCSHFQLPFLSVRWGKMTLWESPMHAMRAMPRCLKEPRKTDRKDSKDQEIRGIHSNALVISLFG